MASVPPSLLLIIPSHPPMGLIPKIKTWNIKIRSYPMTLTEQVIYRHQTNQLGEKLTHEKVPSSSIFKTIIYFLMFRK